MSAPFRPTRFRFKSSPLDAISLILNSIDLAEVEKELKTVAATGFFEETPLVIDLSEVSGASVDFQHLAAALARCGLNTAGVLHLPPPQEAAARAAGLAVLPVSATPRKHLDETRGGRLAPLVVSRPVRSGQQIYAPGRDLVILGSVNRGSEVIADGHVHVHGPLRGRAVAGARGDPRARIFSSLFEPELVSIAGIYRTVEEATEGAGAACQVYLEGEQLIFAPLIETHQPHRAIRRTQYA